MSCRDDFRTLPSRFSTACRFRLKIASMSLDSQPVWVRVTTPNATAWRTRIPPWRRVCVRRARSSSARRTCTPLAYGITGENPDYGDCVQPRDARRLTGGSSSGAAASVQEQSALAAIGTDTGGSIRAPAALCGLAGYRASLDLAHQSGLWRGGVHLAPTFDTLGWLFQDLRDAPLLAEALFGLHVPEAAETRLRIGCVRDEFLHDCDAHVLAGFAEWKKKLSDCGATIIPADTEYWEEALEINAAITAHEAAAIHSAKTGGDFSHFPAAIAQRLAWGASISADEIAVFRSRHLRFRERADSQLRQFDFFLAPCAALHELAVGADHTESRRRHSALHHADEPGWRASGDAAEHHWRGRTVDRSAQFGCSVSRIRESHCRAAGVALRLAARARVCVRPRESSRPQLWV